ncbi:hypothetical protein GGI42DRAFT_199731 [Trichoderma sp. SZMC 28013]
MRKQDPLPVHTHGKKKKRKTTRQGITRGIAMLLCFQRSTPRLDATARQLFFFFLPPCRSNGLFLKPTAASLEAWIMHHEVLPRKAIYELPWSLLPCMFRDGAKYCVVDLNRDEMLQPS